MDVEKTMEFILEQQADIATRQANSAQQIEALRQSVQGLVEAARLDHQRLSSLVEVARLDRERVNDLVEVARLRGEQLDDHHQRLEAQEKFQQRFDQFLERFDAFLRGRGGDGR